MADVSNSNLLQQIEGIQNVKDAFVVLVKTEWNAGIVNELERGCMDILKSCGIRFKTLVVPGAVEIPFAIQQCQAHCQSRNTAKQNTEGAFSGYLSQCLFRSLKPSCSQSRVHQRNQQRERNEQGFRPNAREHEQELSSRKL